MAKWALLVVIFFVFALAILSPCSVLGQTKKPYGVYLYGNVVDINHDSQLMTIKGWRGLVTVDITNAKLVGYNDLKQIAKGDRVKVRYLTYGIEIGKIKKAKR